MNPNDPNVVMLELVAERLGDGLRDELVFVGGAVTGLLMSNPTQPIEVLRTIHSFDPCIACAVHVVDPAGEELVQVKVV